uniref:uncharacterized protein LOC122608711 n=1 Tax=Erigeron canadensis TaxID=72917 RepID=UPI001CB93CE2|nr:uncharacterized protein LOC122608711 [Erigeron canadensis]
MRIMGKLRTIDSFFKRKPSDTSDSAYQESKRAKVSTSEPEQEQNQPNEHIPETPRPNSNELDISCLERDPAKRKHMWDYSVNERENVRLANLKLGPFQLHLQKYPAKGSEKHPRRFQYSWFKVFPNWLEYSPTTNAAYCFICYLFSDKPNVRNDSDAFTVKGFDNWKKVNGKNCAFLKHLGSTQHRNATISSINLLNQAAHIDNIIEKQSVEQVLKDS